MIATIVGLTFAAQVAVGPPSTGSDMPLVERVQYDVPVHPPPCGTGWDDMCYPNGYLAPQDQSARQGYYGGTDPVYRGGRYPVPCGFGADLDVRDGQCYPTGTVPPRFQNRPRYHRY